MGKNLIPSIAKELGVEIGEVFGIKNSDYKYQFTDTCLVCCPYLDSQQEMPNTLGMLVCGKREIVKIPFEPKNGDKYYTYSLLSKDLRITSATWQSDVYDYARKKLGWIFRNQKEAENAQYEKYHELMGRNLVE